MFIPGLTDRFYTRKPHAQTPRRTPLARVAALLPGCDAIFSTNSSPASPRRRKCRNAWAPGRRIREPRRQRHLGIQPAARRGADAHADLRPGQGAAAHASSRYSPNLISCQITNGMDKSQVTRILSKPARTMVFPLKKEEVWDWRIEENHPQGAVVLPCPVSTPTAGGWCLEADGSGTVGTAIRTGSPAAPPRPRPVGRSRR